MIFVGKSCTPTNIATFAGGIQTNFPQHIRADLQRTVLEAKIDKSAPWGFFDEASQENRIGGCAILHLREGHFFILTMGLGAGSNNYSEMLSLKLLLIFTTDKGCRALNVFGDSMNVINWTMGTQMCRNLLLTNMLATISDINGSFDSFSCRHVYREVIKEADKALKEGLLLTLGQWKVLEQVDGDAHEFYHRPFIERDA